jgi:hypothetical protein
MMILSNHILLRTAFVLQAAGLPMRKSMREKNLQEDTRESEGDPSTVMRPGGTFHFGNSCTDVPLPPCQNCQWAT